MPYTGYIGSYASDKSTHILCFVFDEGREVFTESAYIFPWKDTKYLSLKGKDFLAVTRREQAGIACFDRDTKETEELFTEKGTSCYIEQDETYIYTANYHEGTLSVYCRDQGIRLHKKITIQEEAGCHQVLLWKEFVLVPCLNLDRIQVFDKSRDFQLAGEIVFPEGSGPRHGVFDSRGTCYVVGERSNQLFILQTNERMQARLEKTVELLKRPEDAAAAAVRLSREENFLYVSERVVNQIAVYDIRKGEVVQRVDSGGDHPRDIALSPDERYLFAANRFTGNVAVFRRDADTGLLTPLRAGLEAPEGVCIVFEE